MMCENQKVEGVGVSYQSLYSSGEQKCVLCKSEDFFFFPSAVLGHFPFMHLPWFCNAGVIIRGSALIRHGVGEAATY